MKITMDDVKTVYCFAHPVWGDPKYGEEATHLKGFTVFVPNEGKFIFQSGYSAEDMAREIKSYCHLKETVVVSVATH